MANDSSGKFFKGHVTHSREKAMNESYSERARDESYSKLLDCLQVCVVAQNE